MVPAERVEPSVDVDVDGLLAEQWASDPTGHEAGPSLLGSAPLALPTAPDRRAHPRPSHAPWWDWRRWRTRNKIFSGVAIALLAALVGVWLALPNIAAYLIRQRLPEIEAKLGRKLSFTGVALDGFTGFALEGVVIYENFGVNADTGEFLTVDRVTVHVDKNPIFHADFKVASIEVDHPRLHLTRGVDGSINFRDMTDFVERLTKPKKPKAKTPAKPNPLAKYFKPLPAITVRDAQLVFDDAFPSPLTIPAVESSEITLRQEAPGSPLEFSVRAGVNVHSAAMGDHRVPLRLEGSVVNGKQGQVRLSFPRGYELPIVRSLLGRGVRLDAVTLELPSTFIVDEVLVEGSSGYQQPLLAARRVRLALTQLPPKKWGGVYIKETHVEGLRVDLVVNEDGRPEIEDILLAVFGARPSPTREAATRVASWMQRSARAGVGLAPPKPKPFNVRDYFVTQRLLVEDGLIRIEDRRPEIGGVTVISDLELEFGYRGIQKLVELAVGFEINTGESGRVAVNGSYGTKSQDLALHVELENLSLEPFHRLLETALRNAWELRKAQAAAGAADGSVSGSVLLYILGTALHLDDAVLNANLDTHVAIKTGEVQAHGTLGARNLRIEEPSLSQLPLDGLNVETAFDARYSRTGRELLVSQWDTRFDELETRASLRFAPLDLTPGGGVHVAPDAHFELSFAVPEQPAQQVFEGIPYALRAHLAGIHAEGTFGFSLQAKGRLDQLGEMELDTSLQSDTLEIVRWPSEVNLAGLNHGMVMRVHDPNALMEHTITLPPSTHAASNAGGYAPQVIADDIRRGYPAWTLYDDLSPWLVQLVTTTEDGSFFRHAGFSQQQVLSALQKNVDEGGFARGASTISMQLIKNVFLGRQKTVARKLQELVLTWLMESVVRVPKKRILEVYFNVIEFGPEIYGIHDAARYYFGKQPRHLTLRETAFLVAIIPRPRTGEMHRLRGEVTPRMSSRIDWYVHTMHKRKCDPEKLERIREQFERRGTEVPFSFCCPSPTRLEQLLSQPVTFYNPGIDGPEYRPDLYDAYGRALGSGPNLGCGLESDDIDDSALLDGLDEESDGLDAPANIPGDPERP